MATSPTGIITIAEWQIAKPDEAWMINSSVTGLLEHCGKWRLGNIAVVSQSLRRITAEMMQQMQQGLKVYTTREMHMFARLANRE